MSCGSAKKAVSNGSKISVIYVCNSNGVNGNRAKRGGCAECDAAQGFEVW